MSIEIENSPQPGRVDKNFRNSGNDATSKFNLVVVNENDIH
jgi:hypothetical protein